MLFIERGRLDWLNAEEIDLESNSLACIQEKSQQIFAGLEYHNRERISGC